MAYHFYTRISDNEKKLSRIIYLCLTFRIFETFGITFLLIWIKTLSLDLTLNIICYYHDDMRCYFKQRYLIRISCMRWCFMFIFTVRFKKIKTSHERWAQHRSDKPLKSGNKEQGVIDVMHINIEKYKKILCMVMRCFEQKCQSKHTIT